MLVVSGEPVNYLVDQKFENLTTNLSKTRHNQITAFAVGKSNLYYTRAITPKR